LFCITENTRKENSMKPSRTSLKTVLLAFTALSLSAALVRAGSSGFIWRNLQSDIAGVARRVDPNLINPWGMALSPFNTIWVNDNGTGVATAYFSDGSPAPNSTNPLVVTIPASATNTEGANPTGIVANNTPFFKVTKSGNSQPSRFIFVSEDGSISGWNPQLDNTNAILAVDNGASDAIYKGATLGVASGHNFLYVTNFHSAHVEMYDENFVRVDTPSSFADPNIPAGFAPFGIRNFSGQIFVTYALQDANQEDDVPGAGNGYINVFDTNGHLLRRLVSQGRLNSPWGLALIPSSSGKVLLVGNFGNGRINAYNPTSGSFITALKTIDGTPLAFDGLWDLLPFAGGIYFSAGIADEEHGLFGVIF
jgi:uncharacterized protein (TIGR03118 family)